MDQMMRIGIAKRRAAIAAHPERFNADEIAWAREQDAIDAAATAPTEPPAEPPPPAPVAP